MYNKLRIQARITYMLKIVYRHLNSESPEHLSDKKLLLHYIFCIVWCSIHTENNRVILYLDFLGFVVVYDICGYF